MDIPCDVHYNPVKNIFLSRGHHTVPFDSLQKSWNSKIWNSFIQDGVLRHKVQFYILFFPFHSFCLGQYLFYVIYFVKNTFSVITSKKGTPAVGLSLILKLLGTVFPRQKSTSYTKKRKILKSGLQVSENIPKHFRDNFQIFFNLWNNIIFGEIPSSYY